MKHVVHNTIWRMNMAQLRGILVILLVSAVTASALKAQEFEFQFAYRPMAFEVLKKNVDKVDLVAPEPFIIDNRGMIHGELEPRLLDLAREHDLKVMPQVKNLDKSAGLFSQLWVNEMLNDPQAVDRAIASMLELCRKYGLYGIQIDLEAVHIDDRDALTDFYRKTAESLHQEGYKISIAVVHRFEKTGGANSYTRWMMEDWRGGYDLKKLGEISDFVKVMSYAQHTRRTTPGPSQGLPWLTDVMDYMLEHIPAEKLSMGLNMRSFHYHTVADPDRYHINARSWSRSLSLNEVESLMNQYDGMPLTWDDRQKVLYGYIERGGTLEWFFVDNDPRSLQAKLDLARDRGINMLNMWVFGDEDPAFWKMISN